MQLAKLEEALRTAMRSNPMQPALAILAADGPGNLRLPAEFGAAAKSLVERLRQKVNPDSTGRTAEFHWM